MTTIEQVREEQITIETLPLSSLNVDITYQRSCSPYKVRMIRDHFDRNACGVIIVSQRTDGRYFVVDGQHRVEAMRKRAMEQTPCQVMHGLTVAQEAEIFIDCNTVRKTPEALDVFKARLMAKEPVAEVIQTIVERHGLHIQLNDGHRGGTRHIDGIWAVGALETIYKRGKEELLDTVLTLILRSWPDTSMALEAKVLLGVMHFHLKYQGKYSREDFIAKMSITDLKSLFRRAQYHAEVGGHGGSAFAKALQETYDKKRKTTRLEKGEER